MGMGIEEEGLQQLKSLRLPHISKSFWFGILCLSPGFPKEYGTNHSKSELWHVTAPGKCNMIWVLPEKGYLLHKVHKEICQANSLNVAVSFVMGNEPDCLETHYITWICMLQQTCQLFFLEKHVICRLWRCIWSLVLWDTVRITECREKKGGKPDH